MNYDTGAGYLQRRQIVECQVFIEGTAELNLAVLDVTCDVTSLGGRLINLEGLRLEEGLWREDLLCVDHSHQCEQQ